MRLRKAPTKPFSEDLSKFGTGSKDKRKESPVNSAGKRAVLRSGLKKPPIWSPKECDFRRIEGTFENAQWKKSKPMQPL